MATPILQSYHAWQKRYPMHLPSNAEMAQASLANADAAARDEREAQLEYDRSAPGTPKCVELYRRVEKAQIEQRHWRGYAAYYRALAALDAAAARRETAQSELGGGLT